MRARQGAWTGARSSPRSIGRREHFLARAAFAAVIAPVVAALIARPAGGQAPPVSPHGGTPPLSAFAVQKAERLLRERLPCLGCHALAGDGGRLAPDLATARTRRSPDYIAGIIADPQRVAPGAAMPQVPMPPATRELIVRYLATRPGDGTAPAIPTSRATTRTGGTGRTGEALYARWCAGCHGARGDGDGVNAAHLPVVPAPLSEPGAMTKRPDDSLYDAIAGGGAIMSRSPRMPPFGATLAPGELRELVRHIRTLCRCRGPAWSRDSRATAGAGR